MVARPCCWANASRSLPGRVQTLWLGHTTCISGDSDLCGGTGGLTDVGICLCAGLDPRRVVLFGELLAFFRGHLSGFAVRRAGRGSDYRGLSRSDATEPWDVPRGQVGLRADDDARYLVEAAEIDDLVVHDLDHVEGLARRHRVDEHEAMDADRVLRVQDRVLVLCTTTSNA